MAKLNTFPVSLKVAGRQIIVVGGGIEALNKTRLALKTNAHVSVWAREFDPGFDDILEGRLTLNRREQGLAQHLSGSAWLADAVMIFVADDGPDGEFALASARDAGVLINAVDRPDICAFYTPAIIDRAPVSVAIATEGAAPVLARQIRARVEAALPVSIGRLADLAGGIRDTVAFRLPDGRSRRRFYEKLVDSPDIELALAKGPEAADRAMRDLLEAHASAPDAGMIVWVGAGSGAEDLLTLRAQRVLQGADVIVHDQDVPSALIEMGRRDAERIALRTCETATRASALMIRLAERGRRVVRLIAGDARADSGVAAELAAARQAGIFVSVVPGIGLADTETDTATQVLSDSKRVA